METTVTVDGRQSVVVRMVLASALVICTAVGAAAQSKESDLPELTQPVNDFAGIVDQPNAERIDRLIRTLKAATGDVVIVATVTSIEPYGDIREYANKMFENHGRGIGERGKNNGLLILMSVRDRKVWIEVGYDLEQWVTDGFAGETVRQYMAPAFREGRYGDGLQIGTERVIGRIAQGRNVTLDGVRVPREDPDGRSVPFVFVLIVFIAILALSRIGRGPRRGIRTWGGGGWSGWSSGVGPFGGGWGGGGGGGGGFGGGFGGFGGGSSGGGGGGGSW